MCYCDIVCLMFVETTMSGRGPLVTIRLECMYISTFFVSVILLVEKTTIVVSDIVLIDIPLLTVIDVSQCRL